MLKKIKDTLVSKSATAQGSGETKKEAEVVEIKTEAVAKKAPKSDAATVAKIKDEMTLTDEQKASVMGKLSATMKNPPMIGDLVEGPVIAIEKSSVYIDLAPFGTGIIYGREFITARDVIKKINVGDVVAAKIVDNAH